MIAKIQTLISDEAGTETMEYALVLGLIIVATMAIIAQFGSGVVKHWTQVNKAFH